MLLADFEDYYRKIFDSIENPSLKKDNLDELIISASMFSFNPKPFCIINQKSLDFDFMSKCLHNCMGLSKSELKLNGLNYIWSRIHPDDINCLFISLDKLLNFIKTLDYSKKNQFSFSWNYRLKKHDGTYINIIESTTPFYITNNYLKKGFVSFQVVNSQFNLPVQASLNVLNSNGSFKSIYSDNCSQSSFLKSISNREKDIIKLLLKDETSKSIGLKLFISPNTVDTHRRNILKKLKLSSTGELINILKSQHNML